MWKEECGKERERTYNNYRMYKKRKAGTRRLSQSSTMRALFPTGALCKRPLAVSPSFPFPFPFPFHTTRPFPFSFLSTRPFNSTARPFNTHFPFQRFSFRSHHSHSHHSQRFNRHSQLSQRFVHSTTRPPRLQQQKDSATPVLYALSAITVVVGLTYAAVPLYRLFCQVPLF